MLLPKRESPWKRKLSQNNGKRIVVKQVEFKEKKPRNNRVRTNKEDGRDL